MFRLLAVFDKEEGDSVHNPGFYFNVNKRSLDSVMEEPFI